jgi:hypothetical protein
MTRGPSAASSPRPSWQSLRSLSRFRSVPAAAASAALLVGFGALAVTTIAAMPEQEGPRWLGRIDDVPAGRTTQVLGATAIGLETELRQVDAGHGGVRALDAQLVRLRDAQADLGKQQASLESRLAAAIELAAIKGTFDLEEEVRALRLVPAALLLRETAQSGRPFAPALEQFSVLAAGGDNAYREAGSPMLERLAALRPYAETGVVSWRDLRRSLASLPGLIERAQPSSWWDRALVMVGWRDDPLGPLHEAQAALLVDDLEGAIAVLAALQGEAALASEGWLDLARARLAADAIVDELYRTALAAAASPPAAGSTLASRQAAQGMISANPLPR